MYRKTKIMSKKTHSLLLGLFISLILSCFAVNADTPKTTTPEVKYRRYKPYQAQKYHRFLNTPAPKGLRYNTRMAATANIDDTPEKETVALMLVDIYVNLAWDKYFGEWVQAFLLIADTEAGELQQKALFKLYDTGRHALEVPAAKSIELQNPALVFTQPPKDVLQSHAAFELVDLTGDGILDVWVESTYGVVVISFQNGEFKEIFSTYTVPGFLSDAEYVDLDTDGTYEIKIPYSIPIEDVPGAPHLEWMSLYEWDGNAYILNNERFYAESNELLIQLLGAFNYQMFRHGDIIYQCETYRFYLGLLHHYQGSMSPRHLQWIFKHGKNENYVQAVEDILFYSGLVYAQRGELPRAQIYLQYIATEAENQDYRKDADAMLTEIWNKTDDREAFEREYSRHLNEHYIDMPAVRTFIAGKKKLMSGSFRFPGDEDKFLRFYEAKYDLWPNETVLRELEKVRKAKAEGTPFNLIDWDSD